MARPIKDGVSYWPFDVDMLDDDKFKLIRAEFGIKGVYIALGDEQKRRGLDTGNDLETARCLCIADDAGACVPAAVQHG